MQLVLFSVCLIELSSVTICVQKFTVERGYCGKNRNTAPLTNFKVWNTVFFIIDVLVQPIPRSQSYCLMETL